MLDVKELANKADVIIDGYAFFKHESGVRVLNLNNTAHAAVFPQKKKFLKPQWMILKFRL